MGIIFNYDMINKKIIPISTSNDCYIAQESKDIGELLLDFLNLDLQSYPSKKDEIEDFYVITGNNIETIKLIQNLYKSYNHVYLSLDFFDQKMCANYLFEKECYDLKTIQTDFRQLADVVLSANTAEQYSGFCRLYDGFTCYEFKEFHSLVPCNSLINFENLSNNYFQFVKGYTFDNPEEALMCEFFRLLELGVRIKKCIKCGKYFIVKNSHNSDCCSRKCQQAQADIKQREKINNHPILKFYTKINKRMFARKKTGKLSEVEYADWVRQFTDVRNKYVQKYNSETDQQQREKIEFEFIEILNNSC